MGGAGAPCLGGNSPRYGASVGRDGWQTSAPLGRAFGACRRPRVERRSASFRQPWSPYPSERHSHTAFHRPAKVSFYVLLIKILGSLSENQLDFGFFYNCFQEFSLNFLFYLSVELLKNIYEMCRLLDNPMKIIILWVNFEEIRPHLCIPK